METKNTTLFTNENDRWQAVQLRDTTADSVFFYGVITTGVYCYPSCPSRGARRENVRFYSSRAAAEQDGLRSCKRCLSDQPPLAVRHRQLVERACRMIEASDARILIEDIAVELGVSRFHLQRIFRSQTGLSPKAYEKAIRTKRVQAALASEQAVTDAIFNSGYESASSFYTDAGDRLGMAPRLARDGGRDVQIYYAFSSCSLGLVLVGVTENGVSAVQFGENRHELVQELQQRYPKAVLQQDDAILATTLAKVVAVIDQGISDGADDMTAEVRLVSDCASTPDGDIALDIRGTVFQEKVWRALRMIPRGTTASYRQIAESIGQPTSSRAVAQACGRNPVAVLIPCHRVIRADGEISGYRWGVKRKSALLQREASAPDTQDEQ